MKKAVPLIAKTAKSKIVKKSLNKIKKQAAKSAIGAISDVMSKKDPKERLQNDMKWVASSIGSSIVKDITGEPNTSNIKQKKKSNKFTNNKWPISIFDQ